MIEDSWDEDIYEDRAYCSYCGKDVTGDTDHIGECGEEYYDEDLGMTIHEGASSIIRPTKIKTVHHPAQYETQTTKYITGYKCSKCGATK